MEFNKCINKRVNNKDYKKKFTEINGDIEKAGNFDETSNIIREIYKQRNHFESMSVLASIRHSIDTNDTYYDKENDYYDEVYPVYQGLIHDFYNNILTSPFRKNISEKWGEMLLNIAELSIKIYSDDVVEELTAENKLVSSYSKLLASAKIEYDGKINNLSQMAPYLQSPKREIRKDASEKIAAFFIENEKQFDEIYDNLVKIRHSIAVKLGYDNFI